MAANNTAAPEIAGVVGLLGLVGILAIAGSSKSAAPAPNQTAVPPSPNTPPDVTTVCQFCQCNNGVVPCAIPGTTLPTGLGCSMCVSPDGSSIVPCYGAASTASGLVARPGWKI